jgi:hypothetical protein
MSASVSSRADSAMLDLRDSAERRAGGRMLDFRIIVAAIIVCVSLVMIGTRVLSTSDAFNIAAGSRAGIRTMSDPVRPSIALSPTAPATVELPAPPQPSMAERPASPVPTVMPAATAKPQPPMEAAAANSSASDITGSIPTRSETADAPARRPPGAAPSPTVQPNRTTTTTTAPVSELTGSIFSHPESQPNVEPDWKQNPPRRSVDAPVRARPNPGYR